MTQGNQPERREPQENPNQWQERERGGNRPQQPNQPQKPRK
jgi:hypothetical protein